MKDPSIEVPRRAVKRDRGQERPVEKTTEGCRDRGDGEEIPQRPNRGGGVGAGLVFPSLAICGIHRSGI
jgi:hypothetical protein